MDDRMINLRDAENIVRFECGEWRGLAKTIIDKLEALPSAQQIPWDKNTRNSMVNTLQTLYRLAYNIHGVMDAIDDDNVNRLIEWLEGGQDEN